jgi:diguanylate cyclase (GGDEF)-like protein
VILLLAVLWFLYVVFAFLSFDAGEYLLAPVLSLFVAILLFSAATCSRKFFVCWAALAGGLVFWGFSEAVWAYLSLLTTLKPETCVPLAYLYTVPNFFMLAGIFLAARFKRRRLSLFQFSADTVAIGFSISGFIYFSFFGSGGSSVFFQTQQGISYFINLVLDILIVTFSVLVFLQAHDKKKPVFLDLILVAFALFVVSDFFYLYSLSRSVFFPDKLIDILYLLSVVFFGFGALVFIERPQEIYDIGADMLTGTALFHRSLLLLLIPFVAGVLRMIHRDELIFFVLIILLHQIVSLLIRQLALGEREMEQKSRYAEMLEETIADRTRDLRIMNQTLENLLERDAITGQFNRKFFLEYLDESIRSAEDGEKIWLLILDLDRFKTLNDTYGHDIGDQTLRLLGKRLESLSNERTLLARLGGDEFGLICRRSPGEDINPLLHTIADMSEQPLQMDSFTVHVSISIGVSCWPDDARTRSDLMRHADIAMYIGKNERPAGVSFFEKSVNAEVERSHQIDLSLKKAHLADEFAVVYQPQFAIGGRKLVGMEALVRWTSPEYGNIPPDEFIPVAEDNGVIIPLSDWILHAAFSQIADWNNRYSTDLKVGINISPLQLDDVTFMLKLEAALDDFRVNPEWVNLEITERCAMKGEAFMTRIFNRFSDLNITSSIDDFGTGYSSLSYLKKFEIDYLKIAKQLIDGIATNDTDAQIVQAIIMMATALNLHTIAEGVEDEAQFTLLASLGCDEIQGFYLGKPAPPVEFEELFLKGKV